MNLYADPPEVLVRRPGVGATVDIPKRFFEGTWSTVAVAVYFHILMDENGLTLWHLSQRHPNIAEGEILTALEALERHGFIEQDLVPCNEAGYVATGITYDEEGATE